MRLLFLFSSQLRNSYNCDMAKYKKVERWRDIPGYEDYYQISTYGRILAKFRYVQYTDQDGCERWKRVESHLLNDKKRGKGGYVSVLLRGSGSSAIAAYDLGFEFTGIEIDDKYFADALRRFESHKIQQKLYF